MTDPRINPAGEGGAGPPEPSGRESRHGLFRHGSSQSGSAGASATATQTTTTTTSTTTGKNVPQQVGEAPYERGRTDEDYRMARGERADDSGAFFAKAAYASFSALLLGGLAMIAVGIMLLVWPHASLTVVAILIGAALVVSGLVRLWEGLTGKPGESGGQRAGYVVIGLLAVIAGLYCLRHHAVTIYLIAFVTGVYFVAHGISDIAAAISARGLPGRGLRATLGVFSIAAGLILVVWPGLSLVLLLTIMAAWLLFYGVMLCALAFHARKAGKALTAEHNRETTMAAPQRAA